MDPFINPSLRDKNNNNVLLFFVATFFVEEGVNGIVSNMKVEGLFGMCGLFCRPRARQVRPKYHSGIGSVAEVGF